MKRRIVKVCILLLLGAIVNVAVAWGFAVRLKTFGENNPSQMALLGTPHFSWQVERRGGLSPWVLSRYQKWEGGDGASQVVGDPPETLIPNWSALPRSPTEYDMLEQRHQLHLDVARGWPCLALHSQMLLNPLNFTVISLAGAIQTPWFDIEPGLYRIPIVLPIRIIWPGFAINTVLYAAVLWLVFAFPFALRRFIRRKRGLCPACAYPVGSSEVCTECGGPVLPRRGIGM